MSKVKSASDLGSVADNQLRRWVAIYLQELSGIINGSLEFGINIKGAFIQASFPVANDQVRVAHGLGRVPQGYLVTNINANAVIYANGTPSDSTNLYLKASGVCEVTLFIF